MATVTPARATIDDLFNTEGKAELIGGRIVENMATGHYLGLVALEIAVSLHEWFRRERQGIVHAESVGYVVPELSSGRESFCPDLSYFNGPRPTNRMKFISGPPTLAVEVRSENGYGPAAEREMAAKRADYFEAGTKVVWDVDTVDEVIHVYRCDNPDAPTTYGRGQTAEAEPAAPGWRAAVDDLFPSE